MIKWLLPLSIFFTTPLLSEETKVLAFAGSTRKESWNKKLIQNAASIAHQMGAKVTIIDLRDYPISFYDGDLEAQKGMPENAKQLRKLMIASDAIIIATPEYNSSIPAILKNAIDWASRSEDGKPSREAFRGKKFALMSTSLGGGGGARALEHLKTIIEDIDGDVVSRQVAVPSASKAFSPEGTIRDPKIKNQLQQEIQQLFAR